MYGNFGFDDAEQYDRFKDFYNGLFGDTPTPTDDGFQAPELAQGLLGNLLKIGANIALNKWIGAMFPKK